MGPENSIPRRRSLIVFAAAALAFALALPGVARAVDFDDFVVLVRPKAEFAVEIDTAAATLSFMSMLLDSDGFVISPATVTVLSTFAATDMRLDTLSAAGGTGVPWTLGSTNALDTVQVWAVFTSTTAPTIPAKAGDFFDDTNDRVFSGSQQVGDPSQFEDGNYNTDSMRPAKKSHLWLRFHTPSMVTDNDVKNIHLTLTAEQPN